MMNIVEKENKKRNLSSGIVQGDVDILEQILSMSRFFLTFSYKFLFNYKLLLLFAITFIQERRKILFGCISIALHINELCLKTILKV